ncbi:MAG TPA: FAD-dependent oxidoreductase [Candidatus Saccharimonadales bacterium]|nr:FAD-dependent oxidoreductase [Candidatus Saccharimonadales bacterium]
MKKHLLIVGGGFAGIKLARDLAHSDLYRITLISDETNFRYYPTLYRSATGHSNLESCIPLDMLLADDPQIKFVQASVKSIDRSKKELTAKDRQVFKYDICVLAIGVVTSYFGIPGLEKYSHNIKTFEGLRQLRRDLHEEFIDESRPDKNYVIVGAGATGVELAAVLRSYLKKVARNHKARSDKITLELVEAAPRILGRMSDRAAFLSQNRLKHLGVKIMTGSKVGGETHDKLMVNGRSLATHTVIWTAGVTNNPFFEANKSQFTFGPHGRVAVNAYMQVDDSLYVIGDNAETKYSGLALTAVRDAAYLSKNLKRLANGRKPRVYKPKKTIVVLPEGESWALVEWRGITFGGLLGALLRLAADLKGYMDIMPWPTAVKIWFKGMESEENCPICKSGL